MQRKSSENSEYSLAGDSAPGQTLIYHHSAIPFHWKGLHPGGRLLREQDLRVASMGSLSKMEKRKLLQKELRA